MPISFLDRIVAVKQEEIAESSRRKPEAMLRKQAGMPRPKRHLFDMLKAPSSGHPHVIAEVKRASPSKGLIRPDLDAVAYAKACQEGGATAMSVLTDNRFFHGSLGDAQSVRDAVDLPVLRKDFLISLYQVYESRAAGLDAILLIVRILETSLLNELLALCHELDMDALVEIHSEDDLKSASLAGAKLIGINSRDLSTFETDSTICSRLLPFLKPDQVAVAASGIRNRADIDRLMPFGVNNFLIGESIARSPDPKEFLKSLVGGKQ